MSNRPQGVDWAKYQGNSGVWGQSSDEFAIAQIGGIVNSVYSQATYNSQVAAILNLGRRAHTYIWYQVGGDQGKAKTVLDYFLPRIKTPLGSIVALDYEDGASDDKQANTNAILYGMQRIKDAGYTPMYYSYKPYTVAHVDYKQLVAKFGACIWIAGYPTSAVVTAPNYNGFPSLDGIAIWQFTNSYVVGKGQLDGNVDLTGITSKGYDGVTYKPVQNIQASVPSVPKFNLVVDGLWGTKVTLALQKIYDMKIQDGVVSKPSSLIKILQKHLGVSQDGVLGPITIKAMQRALGTVVDGVISQPSLMVKAMQVKLNNGVKPF